METFSEPREFVENTRYSEDRKDTLAALDICSIDEPVVDIVAGFATLSHCFTLQCCYGHFVCGAEQNLHSLEPIPRDYDGMVRYRIGYIAFCIENSSRGRALRDALSRMTTIDPGYVQFGSPDWFWEQRVNSYALQVEPIAHQLKDEAILDVAEALCTQRVRDLFFRELRELMAKEMSAHARG
jgi:hypothetical protein